MSEDDLFLELPSGIRLCYRTDGAADGRPVLLIAGLALDLTSWSGVLVGALVDAGLRVLRVDNRDAGRSTHVATPPPSTLRQAVARPRREDYDLADMASDMIGLLDQLGIDRVDLIGMSMGGMIAQTVAARYPARVRSLTSIISTTGERGIGQPARSTLVRMARPSARNVDSYIKRHLSALRTLGSPAFPIDAASESKRAREVWARGGGRAASAGSARQVAAIQKSGDRTEQVGQITAPTLVIHGERDVMVHPSGGRATVEAIPGARLVTIPDMRHGIPDGVVPQLAPLILEHLASVGSVR
ncbi:MAG TPA: alpha/beta fold hydrolase [Galbitalea sp.]|jgi:pimeloyl-ACP methyl ester carboxylesterase|nr:alpha/beta fold hydrolase [Galbitalea sp.]